MSDSNSSVSSSERGNLDKSMNFKDENPPKFTILNDLSELQKKMNLQATSIESPLSAYLNELRKNSNLASATTNLESCCSPNLDDSFKENTQNVNFANKPVRLLAKNTDKKKIENKKNLAPQKISKFSEQGKNNQANRQELRLTNHIKPGVYVYKKTIDLTKDLSEEKVKHINLYDKYKQNIIKQPNEKDMLFSEAISRKR